MSTPFRSVCLGVFLTLQAGLGQSAIPTAPAAASTSPFAPPANAALTDFALLVEPLSAEWEARLVPPMLQNLLRIAPYTTVRAEPADALRAVAGSSQRLALLRRSSAIAAGAGDNKGIELLEIGPASCLTLVVRQDSIWKTYADLNYGSDRPLRVEAVSPGARQDFQRLLNDFPIGSKVLLLERPTHIAVQRLVAGDADLVVLDVPRRGASDQPEDVMTFVTSRDLRLLELPLTLDRAADGRKLGEVVVSKGWFWESPRFYRSLCDPFVLAMPTTGADQLIYALYSKLAEEGRTGGTSAPAQTEAQPGFFATLSDAFRRLLVAAGILSP